MAVLALISCRVEINAVDMSQYVTGVELPVDAAELETTNFASGGWKTVIGGLKSGTAKVMLNDDFAATTVDDRLWPLFGTVVTLKVRPTSAAISATNPEYQTSVLINSLAPVQGNVGDLATQDLTWPLSGAVTRAVA